MADQQSNIEMGIACRKLAKDTWAFMQQQPGITRGMIGAAVAQLCALYVGSFEPEERIRFFGEWLELTAKLINTYDWQMAYEAEQ